MSPRTYWGTDDAGEVGDGIDTSPPTASNAPIVNAFPFLLADGSLSSGTNLLFGLVDVNTPITAGTYTMVSDYSVSAGVTLTIDPGVTIEVLSGSGAQRRWHA